MAAVYGAKIRAVLSRLQTIISARATADGITIGECKIGLKGPERAILRQGVYIFTPDDREGEANANAIRSTTLDVPVLVQTRDFVDRDGTLGLVDMVGVVIDAISANHTLNGRCTTSFVTGGQVEEVSQLGEILYRELVTITVDIDHPMG